MHRRPLLALAATRLVTPLLRRFAAASALGAAVAADAARAAPEAGAGAAHRRPIPKAPDSTIPVIGLGTWQTFDVGQDDPAAFAQRQEVLRRFFAAGGGMVDSSPMYGRAEWLVGELLKAVPAGDRLVAATKVWTPFDRLGPTQFDRSLALWGLPRMDVSLVHNLLNLRDHLPMLRERQARGQVRWIGISTSHGRDHDEVAAVLRREPIDVLQITYNLVDASAEPLLELAAERRVAVVVNRPFDGGWLFRRVGREPVPAWAREALGCEHWSQLFLKWIVAHPAVTCAIPATRDPAHLDENMAARLGPLPDAAQRRQLQQWIASR